MKSSEYEELRRLLLKKDEERKPETDTQKEEKEAEEDEKEEIYVQRIKMARIQFPWLQLDTVMAILSQERSKKLRREYYTFTSPSAAREYVGAYSSGMDIVHISKQKKVPPCIVLRTLLQSLLRLNKTQISGALKDPPSLLELPNPTGFSLHKLVEDAERCIQADKIASPRVEMVRRVAGLEYERMLRERLRRLGIAFVAEDALRAAGFSKTPDVKLEVPVGVCGRIVNWVDSKASFGDHYIHKIQGLPQFQRYVNRFGSGLVIYWFGFIEEFDDHPDVLLLDHFPKDEDIYCLSKVNVQPRP